MKDCCEITADFTERQRRVLRVVLWINVAMFLVESTAGLLAHSTALLAIAALFATSAVSVIRDARRHLRPLAV